MKANTKVALLIFGGFVAGEVYGRASANLKMQSKLIKLKTKTTGSGSKDAWSEELSKDITTWFTDKDDPRNAKEFLSEVITRFSDELKKRLNDPEEDVIDVEDASPSPSPFSQNFKEN
jgi:hypothetical protein